MASHVTFKWKQYLRDAPDPLGPVRWVDIYLVESDGLDADGNRLNPARVGLAAAGGQPRAATTTLMNKLVAYALQQHGKTLSWSLSNGGLTVRLDVSALAWAGIGAERKLQRLCNRLTEFVTGRIAQLDPNGELPD